MNVVLNTGIKYWIKENISVCTQFSSWQHILHNFNDLPSFCTWRAEEGHIMLSMSMWQSATYFLVVILLDTQVAWPGPNLPCRYYDSTRHRAHNTIDKT